MDFLDPTKKRGYNIRLFVGMVLIAIAITLGTIILALFTAGYSINSKTGQIIQKGLMFVNSQPVSANISINGVGYGTTNARLDLQAGSYSVVLKQTGYRTWTNSVNLLGGDVEELIYPFLFPTNPVQTQVLTLASEPMIATTSPDRHWLLVSVPNDLGSFYVIDLTNPKSQTSVISVPTSVIGSQPGNNVLSLVQWSTDNQHLLIKDSYTGGNEYIMVDRTNPSNSVNINQAFNSLSFTDIKLDNNSFDNLYLYNQQTGSLVLANLTTKTTTNILSNVISYWPYSNNQILYVTQDLKDSKNVDAELWQSSGNKSDLLRELPSGSSYQLNMASFSGHLYAVVGSSSSHFAYIYEDPLSQISASPGQLPLPDTLLVVNGPPQNITFSDSARFIALQSSNQFSVYDLQYQTHYRYSLSQTFLANQNATWMDGNRLYSILGGEVVIWDFDGTNQVSYAESSTDFLANFNTGYSAVYTVAPISTSPTGQWQIIRNSLIAGQP